MVQPMRVPAEEGERPEAERVHRAEEVQPPAPPEVQPPGPPFEAPTRGETPVVQPMRVSGEEPPSEPAYGAGELTYAESRPVTPSETEAPVVRPLRSSAEEREPSQVGPSRPSPPEPRLIHRAQQRRPRPYRAAEPERPAQAETRMVRRLEETIEEVEAQRSYRGPEPGLEVRRLEPHAPPSRRLGEAQPAAALRMAAEAEPETEAHYTALTPAYDTEVEVRPVRARAAPGVERYAEAVVQRRVIRAPDRDQERRPDEGALPPVRFLERPGEELEARTPVVQRWAESQDTLRFAVRERKPSLPRKEPLPLQQVSLSRALFGAQPEGSSQRVARQPAEPDEVKTDQRRAQPLPPPSPVTQVNVIRRATAEAEGGVGVPAGVTAQTSGAASPEETSQPDIDELADKVYRRIRERLRLERERFGAFRYR